MQRSTVSPAPKFNKEFFEKYGYLLLIDIPSMFYDRDQYQKIQDYDVREKDYAKALLNAYRFAFKQKKKPGLDHEIVLRIHEIAVGHLKHTVKVGEYRTDTGYFRIISNDAKNVQNPSATNRGLREFVNKWLVSEPKSVHMVEFKPVAKSGASHLIDKPVYLIFRLEGKVLLHEVVNGKLGKKEELQLETTHRSLIEKLLGNQEYVCRIYSMDDDLIVRCGYGSVQEAVYEKMQAVFDSYEAEIAKADTARKKLTVIIKHVQHINQLHGFKDGNIRLCEVLMAMLMSEQGLPLTMWLDPNRLDCFSIDELVALAIKGQEDLAVFLQGEVPLFTDPYTAWHTVANRPVYPQKIPNAKQEVEGFINDVLLAPPIAGAAPVQVSEFKAVSRWGGLSNVCLFKIFDYVNGIEDLVTLSRVNRHFKRIAFDRKTRIGFFSEKYPFNREVQELMLSPNSITAPHVRAGIQLVRQALTKIHKGDLKIDALLNRAMYRHGSYHAMQLSRMLSNLAGRVRLDFDIDRLINLYNEKADSALKHEIELAFSDEKDRHAYCLETRNALGLFDHEISVCLRAFKDSYRCSLKNKLFKDVFTQLYKSFKGVDESFSTLSYPTFDAVGFIGFEDPKKEDVWYLKTDAQEEFMKTQEMIDASFAGHAKKTHRHLRITVGP